MSIVGEEVFSFKLSLFPGATQGDGYRDMSKVDGKVTLSLGCIQIVYLHKFFMSLLVSSRSNTHSHTLSLLQVQCVNRAGSAQTVGLDEK